MNATPEIQAALKALAEQWPDTSSCRYIDVRITQDKPTVFGYWNHDCYGHRYFNSIDNLIADVKKSSTVEARRLRAAKLRAEADALEKEGA